MVEFGGEDGMRCYGVIVYKVRDVVYGNVVEGCEGMVRCVWRVRGGIEGVGERGDVEEVGVGGEGEGVVDVVGWVRYGGEDGWGDEGRG